MNPLHAPRSFRATSAAAVMAASLLALTACGSSPATPGSGHDGASSSAASTDANAATRTIKHDAGETEIKGDVDRVVALEFSFVDSLGLLGEDAEGIADDNKEDRITQLNGGQKLDYTSVGTRSEPNLEVIASLRPQLIIADTDRHSKIYEQLSRIAPTIVLNSREGSYQDMKDNTITIAEALGERSRGEQVVAEHEKRMEDIASTLKKPGTRAQLVTARDELLRLHTDHSFVGSVMETVGLDVPVKSDGAYEDASLERIAQVNPKVMFVSSDVDTPITDKWAGNPLWENMQANKTGHTYPADRNLFTRFRGLKSAEAIAEQVVAKVNES